MRDDVTLQRRFSLAGRIYKLIPGPCAHGLLHVRHSNYWITCAQKYIHPDEDNNNTYAGMWHKRDITPNSYIHMIMAAIQLISKLDSCNKPPLIKKWWRHQMETFSALLAIFAGNLPVIFISVNFPHKGLWRGYLVFSLICSWINGWVNNGEAGDLRLHRALYDITVMRMIFSKIRTKMLHPNGHMTQW